MSKEQLSDVIMEVDRLIMCADFDEDCADIPCKTTCWLYDPEKGLCPYLATGIQGYAKRL